MIDCNAVREWLPWYVSGRLALARLERMTDHIARCPACQAELSELVALRLAFRSTVDSDDAPIRRVWAALSETVKDRSSARIDVGSFLVGLQIGIASRGRGASIDGRMNVLGRTVRILGTSRKGA